ncbi:hypothetical protein ACIBAI_27835 [Streptomyces sp. NPDC051041]
MARPIHPPAPVHEVPVNNLMANNTHHLHQAGDQALPRRLALVFHLFGPL